MITRTQVLWLVAALIVVLSDGCGTTGSRAPVFPEVRFQVRPRAQSTSSGQSTFRVNELDAGGVRHTFPPDTVFTVTSPFDFYFENAPAPYGGSFTLMDGDDIEVTLLITPTANGSTTTSCGVGSTVTFPSAICAPAGTAPAAGTPAATPATQEIRFDVCVPSLTPGTCFTGGDAGVFGLPFSGTLGDAAQTHLVGGNTPQSRTPSIFFFEGAQDSVNAKFRLPPGTGQRLVVQLFINGVLSQTASGTDEVQLRQDL